MAPSTSMLLVLAVILSGCASQAPAPDEPATPPATVSPAVASPEPPLPLPTGEPDETTAAVAADVRIDGAAFQPTRLDVQAGERVTWLNADATTHTVSATSAAWSSDNLAPGDAYSRTFDAPGTYAYLCRIHPQMRAEIVVHGEGESEPSPPSPTPEPAPSATPEPTPPPEDPPEQNETAPDEDTATPPARSVDISGFLFAPSSMRIAPGTTVTWTNHDSAPHTSTHEDDAFESGTLNQGDTYAYTFSTPGTYEYRCRFHSSMRAVVIVE